MQRSEDYWEPESVSLVIKNGGFNGLGILNISMISIGWNAMMMDVDGTRQTGHPGKTWWDCVKEDVKNLGILQDYTV